jgi:hypothetical protein
MRSACSVRRLAGLAGAALVACAGGQKEKAVDLTPFAWTWSQVRFGDTLLRYGHPDEPADSSRAAAFSPAAVGSGASATPLATYHYGCARDPEDGAPCTVFLDFQLLEFEPPLASPTLEAHRARLEQVYGPPAWEDSRWRVSDAHGHEWYHRALELGAGAAFSHYSRPIDVRRGLAVTSYTTRAPDRIAARNLAGEAIDRTLVPSEQE